MRKSTVTLLLALFSVVNLAAQVNLSNGLVAYYPFNGNANDESGNGNNGTIQPGITNTNDRSGYNASALNFPGGSFINDGNGVIVSNTSSMNFSSSFSISLWFKWNGTTSGMNNVGNWQHLISKGRDVVNSYGIAITPSTSELTFYVRNSPTYTPALNVKITNGLLPWNNVTAIADVTKQSLFIFINGQLSESKTFSGFNVAISNFYDLGIGFHNGDQSAKYTFNGAIDDVRLYNRAINEAEIQALYTENQPVDLQNGLVAYYPFNGNANDESGNGNNGTFINGVTYEQDHNDIGNSCASFTGTNYMNINTIVGNFGLGDFTICAWVSTNDNLAGQRIFAKRYATDYSNPFLSLNIVGNVKHFGWELSQGNYVYDYLTDDSNIIDNYKWYLVNLIRKNNIVYLYVNGLLSSTKSIANLNCNNNELAQIGVYTDHLGDQNHFFKGKIDDIRIYNRALNEAEIKALYEECSSISAPSIAITSNKLNTTSLAGFNYQWYLNESTISGANSNVLNDPLQIGVYKVKAKTGSCEAFSQPFNIGSFPDPATISGIQVITVVSYKIIVINDNGNTITGVIQRKENETVSIYPNPSMGIFRIESNLVPIEKIEIFNLQGAKVYETKENEINIKGMPSGSYLIKLFDSESKVIETRKLLIE